MRHGPWLRIAWRQAYGSRRYSGERGRKGREPRTGSAAIDIAVSPEPSKTGGQCAVNDYTPSTPGTRHGPGPGDPLAVVAVARDPGATRAEPKDPALRLPESDALELRRDRALGASRRGRARVRVQGERDGAPRIQ